MSSLNNLTRQTDPGAGRIEGLILRVSDYKENDAIADVLSREGIVSVYARGVQKEKSKNRRLLAPFSKVILNYDPHYSKTMLYLINGSVLDSYWRCADDLKSACISEILASLLLRHGAFFKAMEAFEEMWTAWQNSREKKAMLCACFIMVQILKTAGIVMNVDECTVCGARKGIAGVSLAQGGFVCANCLQDQPRWSRKRLESLHQIVKISFKNLDSLMKDSYIWDCRFLIFLIEWYVRFQDTRLKSLDFLRTLCN